MSVPPDTYATFFGSDDARAHAARRSRRERMGQVVVAAGTVVVLGALLIIPLFLIVNLLPWKPLPIDGWDRLGVLLGGSLKAAVCALLVAVPLGIATAVFNAHFCAPRLRGWIKPSLEILEAIPTVVLGLIAVATLAPWLKLNIATLLALLVIVPALLLGAGMLFGHRMRRHQSWLPIGLLPVVLALVALVVAVAGQRGEVSIVPASPWNAVLIGLALGLAAVPLVFSIAEDALMRIPTAHTQAALALGATRWQALTSIVLPAAASGLVAAIVLGASRCIGETMIVLMASGNTPLGGLDPLTGLRTISAELAIGLPEAEPSGDVYRMLLLATLALFGLTFVLNLLAERARASLRRTSAPGTHAT
jgi:phosphate transport system permease protein